MLSSGTPPRVDPLTADATLEALYRDDELLVVNKPAGLVVHRGWADDEVTALSLARAIAGQWVYPVHRLDRGTSGVLVFALSPAIATRMQELLAARAVKKRYVALVRGLAPERATIDHPIAKEKGKPKLPALTHALRLGSFEVENELTQVVRKYSWVAAEPETGRLHQIRRHLKHINHPIIGDVRYGKSEHNQLFRRRFRLDRMALHAQRWDLPHPTQGSMLCWVAGLPRELAALPEAPHGDPAHGGPAHDA